MSEKKKKKKNGRVKVGKLPQEEKVLGRSQAANIKGGGGSPGGVLGDRGDQISHKSGQ